LKGSGPSELARCVRPRAREPQFVTRLRVRRRRGRGTTSRARPQHRAGAPPARETTRAQRGCGGASDGTHARTVDRPWPVHGQEIVRRRRDGRI